MNIKWTDHVTFYVTWVNSGYWQFGGVKGYGPSPPVDTRASAASSLGPRFKSYLTQDASGSQR